MLRLSPAQLQAIEQAQVHTSYNQLAAHCRTYYPDAVSHLSDTALIEQLQHCQQRAQAYGLTSRRDLYRFVNLALSFGWEFDRDAKLPWMRQYLTDPRVDSPALRLELLVQYAIHRLQVEETNRAQRQAFAPQATDANPYQQPYNPEDQAPISANLLFPNPKPNSLWASDEGDEYGEDYEDEDDLEDEDEYEDEDYEAHLEEDASAADAEHEAPQADASDEDDLEPAALNLNGPALLFPRTR